MITTNPNMGSKPNKGNPKKPNMGNSNMPTWYLNAQAALRLAMTATATVVGIYQMIHNLKH